MMQPLPETVMQQLDVFLAEDLGTGTEFPALQVARDARDVTSDCLVPPTTQATASFLAKAEGVLSGLDVAMAVFQRLEDALFSERLIEEGSRVQPGQTLGRVRGRARSLLLAERTALNLLQHMSGIATLTARYVAAVAGTGAQILDTRKTSPGLRWFEKRAVRDGGGVNHRDGLHDQILIKENHLAAMPEAREGRREVALAVAQAREAHPQLTLEIEVLDPDEAVRAARAAADLILLDNFSPEQTREAVSRVRAEVGGSLSALEASGGVTLENVRAYAESGVERISVGALTHSSVALDVSLLLEIQT